MDERARRPQGTDPAAMDGESAESEPPPRLALDVVVEAGDWAAVEPLQPLVERVAAALAARPAVAAVLPAAAAACVAFASDAEVRALNGRYRARDLPTNVLSFPAPPARLEATGEPRFLGDVVLAAETVAAEAAELRIPLAHHVQHLVLHGVLHLLGLDHETEADALAMETEERLILAALGVADPYCNHD